MIRKLEEKDIDAVINIWLQTNIQAHPFIRKEYWENNYNNVRKALLEANIYIYENKNDVCGFIGIVNEYIAGLFIEENSQSNGLGKKLLDYCKTKHSKLSLKVYEKNPRAIQFYQRQNFKIMDKTIDEDNNEIEYLMIWEKSKI